MRLPNFRPRKVKSRKQPWTIHVPKILRNQGWEQRFFASSAKARDYGETLRRAFSENEQRRNLADKLPEGVTVAEAVQFFVERNRSSPEQRTMTCDELIDAYIEASRLRPRSLNNYRQASAFWKQRYQDRSANTLTAHEIQQVANGLAPGTARGHVAALRAAWNWAALPARGWLDPDNPAAHVETDLPPRGAITILGVEQAHSLLLHGEELVPYWALGLFTGGRPSELQRLEWTDIEDGDVRLVATKGTKVIRQRFVPATENLMAWLEPYRNTPKPVPLSLTRRQRLIFYGKLKNVPAWKDQQEWPQDAVRHTFASHWLAEHADQGRLQYLMGHRSGDMIHDHYLGAVRRKDATRYWHLAP